MPAPIQRRRLAWILHDRVADPLLEQDRLMPLYDYRCAACDVQFELLVRSADVPACPTCGTTTIDRLIGATAPAGRAKAVAGSMRAAAAREGHLSHFSRVRR
jgi:putative FmdB family regulatory protein